MYVIINIHMNSVRVSLLRSLGDVNLSHVSFGANQHTVLGVVQNSFLGHRLPQATTKAGYLLPSVWVTELLLLVAAAFSPGPSLSWSLGELWSKELPLFWGSCKLIRKGPFAYTSPVHRQVMFSGTDVQCVFMSSIGHAQRKGPFKVRRYGKRLQGGSKDLRWLWKAWKGLERQRRETRLAGRTWASVPGLCTWLLLRDRLLSQHSREL